MTGKTKVNELSLCSSGRPGSSWPGEFCVVWTFSLRQDAHTGGMSIPFCGSLGTVFHLPSRNCSNEARHIAFHPALPAIRHSSYFSLWPQRSVCIHRHNVVGQECPLPSEKKKQHLCARHTPYTWNTVLFRIYCSDFPAAVTVDFVFVCASHSSKWILCQWIPRKVIWSWFADLADMECITFLELREENQLSNANQIFFPAVFCTNEHSW